jgi:hypothetical protein
MDPDLMVTPVDRGVGCMTTALKEKDAAEAVTTRKRVDQALTHVGFPNSKQMRREDDNSSINSRLLSKRPPLSAIKTSRSNVFGVSVTIAPERVRTLDAASSRY